MPENKKEQVLSVRDLDITFKTTAGPVQDVYKRQEWGFTGYLYAPPLSEAGSALRSYAAGCKQTGAVFILSLIHI